MRDSSPMPDPVILRDNVVELPGSPSLCVALRRSARARRLSLRISGLDGRATLTLPQRFPVADALAFLHEKEGWLRRALAKVPERQMMAPGGEILFQGRIMRLETGPGRRVRLDGDQVLVPPDPDGTRTGPRLEAFLKDRARAVLLPAVDHYTAKLGRHARAVTLRDTRSRWGSCTADGRLMFSWRLVMAPPEVMDYVAAHEVAHLAHMDHSRAFWDCVGRLMPDYGAHRGWLRTHGARLHGYQFKARVSGDSG